MCWPAISPDFPSHARLTSLCLVDKVPFGTSFQSLQQYKPAMRYRIPEDVVFREVGGEAVLLNLATGTYFGLDGVGTEIWNLLAREGTIDGVTNALLAGYDIEEPRLRLDIEQFIQQLTQKGLLAIEPAHTSHDGT